MRIDLLTGIMLSFFAASESGERRVESLRVPSHQAPTPPPPLLLQVVSRPDAVSSVAVTAGLHDLEDPPHSITVNYAPPDSYVKRVFTTNYQPHCNVVIRPRHAMAANIPIPSIGGSPPQSVEKITRIAQDYEYNAAVPLRYWLRTAATLIREVSFVRSRR